MFYGIDLGIPYTYSVTQTYPSTNLVVARVFKHEWREINNDISPSLHGIYRRYIVPGGTILSHRA
jgi:hypothetical protein